MALHRAGVIPTLHQVISKGRDAALGERDDPLLVALSVQDAEAAHCQVDVFEVELNDLRAARAGVERREYERSVSDADRGITAGIE